MPKKNLFLYALLIPISIGISISFTKRPTASIQTDKNGLVITLAADIYRQFVAENTLVTQADHPDAEAVKRISNRVIAAVSRHYASQKATKQLAGFAWEIHFFENNKVDAWCLPGGKIAVYSALLPVTQSDASLAVVISHEIAHVLLQHGDARMKQYLKEFLQIKDLKTALAANPKETKDFYRMAYGNGDYFGVIRGFSLADEMEADALGGIFCAMAGYHPADAIVFWQRMEKLRGTGRQPELLSTHPVEEKRLTHLKEITDGIAKDYYTPINKN